jgi:hypothetical protein
MSGIATGVFKKLFIKRQDALGVIAAAGAAGSAQSMRRVTSTLDVTKGSFQSAEVLGSQQVRDMRHGVKATGGTLNGELSVGTYQAIFESILRQAAQANVSTGNVAVITANSTGTRTGTFARSAGSFLVDGFKIGDIVNSTGWAAPAGPNNDQYMIVTGLSANLMTVLVLDGTPIISKAAGDNVAILSVGKKIFIPATNQTRDYYTIEHWFADIGQDELFTDAVFTGATITLPPSGMATVAFPIMGLNMVPGQAQYFNAPAAPSTGGILASVNGALIINGNVAGLVTGLTITIAGDYAYPAGDGVIGSNLHPDVLPGVLKVTGQMTVLFADATYRDMFLNEIEASVAVALTADSSPKPGFTSFVMSRIKYSGSTKDDTPTGLALTMPFTALEQVVNGGPGTPNVATTISIQDSAYA